ncbi:uncharacterized protein BP5553_08227 [Venustampulla echinocandica]|uniref:NmrA-like domain-containing protein n=1 Tax=Venustampulla echinocandica TaxID=2656787 RepID=A0A370TG41_9HELO|nr:uncharacterized protein BP5553_08227 [Venustampulla echinocandica]RDL33859.1 hypothetical protein BP5553_08227 [Venustampulla echinocandica]
MARKNILVTGATGQQGGALISALLASNPQEFKIFALTRNASSPSAIRLAAQGTTVIQGDTTKPDAVFSQVPDPYGVFLVTVPTATENEQAMPFIDAAMKSGVNHFIFTSADRGGPVISESDSTPVPHFGTKKAIEQHLKSAGGGQMLWTILRPTSFMDNLSPNFIGKALATMLKQMGSTKVSLIATKDIGRAAALAFARPEVYAGRALTLTGDLLTFAEMNTIFKEETGKDLPTTFKFVVNGLQWAISDLGVTMKYLRDGAYEYDMDKALTEELGLRDFRTWLREDSKFEVKEEAES